MSDTITSDVREFIVSNFLFGQGGDRLTNDDSFLESGIIDSTGVLELVAFLEQRWGISIADRELVPDNLDSVKNVSNFVSRKLETQGAPVVN